MPAITLGLVEVEERLRILRRRLNGYTVVQAASVGLSVIFVAASACVAMGVRAGWWGIGPLSLAAALGGTFFIRRRWLSIQATASLADQRGQLTDRLTTLVDLRTRPRPSRLAPVLVAQTLAMGERWRVRRV